MDEEMTMGTAALIIGISRQALHERIRRGVYENTDPAGLVQQEIEARQRELALLRRRLAAYQVDGSRTNGSHDQT